MSNEVTPAQNIRLEILAVVSYDNAAAKQAIEFVNDERLKYLVFVQQYGRVLDYRDNADRTAKAIEFAEETLKLFESATEE